MFDDGAIFRMDRLRDEKSVLSCVIAVRHEYGFGQAGAAVVERGVRHFHSRELRDVCLKFEDRLQRSLGDLGLIWRVCRIELGARNQRIDDDRNVMPVNARADKRRVFDRIPRCALLEIFDQFGLGECLAG